MKGKLFSGLFACLALLLIVSPLLVGCGTKEATGSSLKVGMMTPSTGVAAEKGAPGGRGIQDAVKYINAELGGINGHKFEVVWRDSGYDMAKVATIVNEFMDAKCLMFTTHASAEMAAAMEIANRAEFPGMSTYVSPINYRPPKHIYAPLPDYGDGWITFAEYYMKSIWKGTGKPKMALHLLANPTGRGALDGVKAKAAELGFEIVAQEEHKATTASEIESLTRIKSKNPDVMFISSTPAPTAVIIKNAKELGMFPGMTIASGHAGFTKALIDLGTANVVEGVYGVYPMVTWDDNVPGVAKAKEYVQKYNPGDTGNVDYLSTWTSTLIVAEILRNAEKAVGYDKLAKGDVEAWRAVEKSGIQKLSGYKADGLIPAGITYTPGDNRLSNSFKVFQIKGGKITGLTDWIKAPLVEYEKFDWFGKK
ncbi:MAG: ABC transporter substrate-binding protein [Chloroflexota bacterium]